MGEKVKESIQGSEMSWTPANKKQEDVEFSSLFLLANKRRAIPPRATVSQKAKWSIVVHARRVFSCKNRCGGLVGVEAIDWRIEEIEKFVRCLAIESRGFFFFFGN